MKKLILKSSLAFIIFLGCSSCSIERPHQDAIKLSEMTMDLSALDLGKPIVLLNYSDTSELQKKISTSITQVIKDAQALISDNADITKISCTINFSAGCVKIIGFTSYNQQQLVNSFKFNHTKSGYERVISPYIARCPEGYNELASCNNFDNPAICVTSAVAAFLSENISSPGDCANVQVSVGTLSTKVCGRTCN